MSKAYKDNRGLSLVELVVTTLMMSMVALIIMLFVSASKNSYIEVQNEVTMQTEADMALTYISNIAEQAMEYGFTGEYTSSIDNNTYSVLTMKAPLKNSSSYDNYYYFIIFEKAENVLRFYKLKDNDHSIVWNDNNAVKEIPNINIDQTVHSAYGNKRKLLARYIDSFAPNVSEGLTSKGLMRMCINLKYGNSVYSADKNIYSRNVS